MVASQLASNNLNQILGPDNQARGVKDRRDTLLDYYLGQCNIDTELDVILQLRECRHHINNARSKLKYIVDNATELQS
jgi:hypothetical protein